MISFYLLALFLFQQLQLNNHVTEWRRQSSHDAAEYCLYGVIVA
jgi:hypothetical protein